MPPITQPPSFRDFQGFEQHVLNTRRRYGRDDVPKEWYEAPAFFFENPASVIGPDAPVTKPPYTDELDFELEVGVVIREAGSDIEVGEADDFILGFTIINDWSARDVQRREARVGLGFAKAKDFATSVGPYIVTPEELEGRIIDKSRGNRYNLEMRAFVNGEQVSQGNLKDMHWTFAEMISQASKGTRLCEGDLIGGGTVGTGCLLEHPERPFLEPGDVVILSVERLGELRNQVV